MLRQALDAAEGAQQHETQRVNEEPVNENTSLTGHLRDSELLLQQHEQLSHDRQGYGAADSSFDDDDDAYNALLDDWEEVDSEVTEPGMMEKIWNMLKSGFFLVANVENLWDTPDVDAHQTPRRSKHLVVFFWFFILATSYASERSTFKLLVDYSGPFRLFAVEMLTGTHALMLSMGMFMSACYRRDFTLRALAIPIVDVGLIAILDTIHLLLVFISGVHVPPTLTVILVQFTLPLTALMTQVVHPDGKCAWCISENPQVDEEPANSDSESPSQQQQQSQVPTPPPQRQESLQETEGALPGWGGYSAEHLWGSAILSLAVLLALIPAIYSISNPLFFVYADPIPLQTAYNTLLFVSSCVPAAASQLYKEHIFLRYKQPVDPNYLNLVLSIFQLIFSSVMAPLVLVLQGLGTGDDWKDLYPSDDFADNFEDGARCFLGLLSKREASDGYPDPARCQFTMGLVLIHSFSIISVGVAVDKICNAGATKVMYRGVSAGIILAVLLMHYYDMHLQEFNYGTAIDSLNLLCLIILIVGSEVYHRVSLQHATFETVYPEVEDLYDADD